MPLVQPLDEHNRTLIRNVRPPDWKNPEPSSCYNLVVLGGGTAGLVTAAGAAGLGARVALVEKALLGGDCLNTGCVPSKGLIRAGRAAHELMHAAEFGFSAGKISVDFGKAMERMRKIRAGISIHDSAERFRKDLGVDVFLGEGMFAGPNRIDVAGSLLRFKKAAICTGAHALVPAIPGISEAGYLTSENVFWLTELPSSMAIIGAGPIGCELAQTFARFGSKVSLIDVSGRLLPQEDRDAAEIVRQALIQEGVSFFLESEILGAERRGPGKILAIQGKGNASELEIAEILVATGRRPNVERMGLEKVNVAFDPAKGVLVNDRLQTSNPDIYAAGDVCSAYKFTHAADAMARIVIANALFMGRQKASSLVIPRCIFTDPELAQVGMREEDAREKGIDAVALTIPLSRVDRAVLDGESEGFARVLLKKGGDRILGATVVAKHAGEMINEISLAMTAGIGLSAIGRTIHPYPTVSEVLRKIADQYNKTRLTPVVSRVLSAWLRWSRGK